MPGRLEIRGAFPPLCITEPFVMYLYRNQRCFSTPEREKQRRHAAKLTIAGQAFVFCCRAAKHCSIIMHCNMHFRWNLNIGAKYRLTKYFSILSTESVDNFVDNEGIRQANERITLSIATKSAEQWIFYVLIIKHLRSVPGHGFYGASYFRSKKNCA